MDRAGGSAVERAVTSLEDLVARASALAAGDRRALLGIVGPPGAGKSTLAAAVVDALEGQAVLVPMDGFHLADSELRRLGRLGRKGAPDTFDAAGYVALLQRIVERTDDVVYAPLFRREHELAEAGALPVPPGVPLVVTEGNYLWGGGPFSPVRELLTETWYVDVPGGVRRQRLVERHVRHGRSVEQARDWVEQTDEPNAVLIESTRAAADVVVQLL